MFFPFHQEIIFFRYRDQSKLLSFLFLLVTITTNKAQEKKKIIAFSWFETNSLPESQNNSYTLASIDTYSRVAQTGPVEDCKAGLIAFENN